MSRISLVIVSVMLCTGGQLSAGTIPTGPILPNDSNETYEQRFLANFPEETGGLLDFDVIDDIDRDELTQLINEISLYHFDYTVKEYDTIPLLAPDGEYRAVLVIYSIDPENKNTYEAVFDYYNNGFNYDELMANSETNEDRDYYSDMAGKYFAKCETYVGLIFGSVNNNIVALGITQYYTYVFSSEHFRDENLEYSGLILLPSHYYYTVDVPYKYVITCLYNQDGTTMIHKAQYDEIIDDLWLKYDIYNDWKSWDLESFRNILFELQ